MSSALSVYLVDLNKVRGAVGSKDEKLRRMIGGRFKAELARADDWFGDQIENGAPTRYEALRAVIDGGPFDEKYGFQYGYAFQMIYEFHGRWLDNSSFCPFRGSWLEDVDEGFRQIGVDAVGVSEFSYGSVPSPLPWAELPRYDEWSPAACHQALAQWEESTPEQRQALDSEVLEAIESCVGWMREARAKDGYGIAGFQS